MNVKDNLLRMKDLSEMMLDLAYSCVFLKDKAILDKVKDMHKEVAYLEEGTLKIIFRIKEPEEDRMFIVDLTDHMKDIANDALSIAELSSVKKVPPIVKDILKESKKVVITTIISHKSSYAHKTVGESHIRTNTKATILGVKRNSIWIFDIKKDFVLMPNDEVVAIGSYSADTLFNRYASGKM